jgi:hypothetical protein
MGKFFEVRGLESFADSQFELFWIPLVPFKSKHIWICGICREYTSYKRSMELKKIDWEMKVGDGNDPQPPQGWNQRPQGAPMHAGPGGYH